MLRATVSATCSLVTTPSTRSVPPSWLTTIAIAAFRSHIVVITSKATSVSLTMVKFGRTRSPSAHFVGRHAQGAAQIRVHTQAAYDGSASCHDDMAQSALLRRQFQKPREWRRLIQNQHVAFHDLGRTANQKHVGMQRLRDRMTATHKLHCIDILGRQHPPHAEATSRPPGSSAGRSGSRGSSRRSSSRRSLPRRYRRRPWRPCRP